MVDGDWLIACVNPFVVRFNSCKHVFECVCRTASRLLPPTRWQSKVSTASVGCMGVSSTPPRHPASSL